MTTDKPSEHWRLVVNGNITRVWFEPVTVAGDLWMRACCDIPHERDADAGHLPKWAVLNLVTRLLKNHDVSEIVKPGKLASSEREQQRVMA